MLGVLFFVLLFVYVSFEFSYVLSFWCYMYGLDCERHALVFCFVFLCSCLLTCRVSFLLYYPLGATCMVWTVKDMIWRFDFSVFVCLRVV